MNEKYLSLIVLDRRSGDSDINQSLSTDEVETRLEFLEKQFESTGAIFSKQDGCGFAFIFPNKDILHKAFLQLAKGIEDYNASQSDVDDQYVVKSLTCPEAEAESNLPTLLAASNELPREGAFVDRAAQVNLSTVCNFEEIPSGVNSDPKYMLMSLKTGFSSVYTENDSTLDGAFSTQNSNNPKPGGRDLFDFSQVKEEPVEKSKKVSVDTSDAPLELSEEKVSNTSEVIRKAPVQTISKKEKLYESVVPWRVLSLFLILVAALPALVFLLFSEGASVSQSTLEKIKAAEGRRELMTAIQSSGNKTRTRNGIEYNEKGIITTKGELTFRVKPRDAKVFLNGQLIGSKTPLRIKNVPLANHSLTIKRPGYRDYHEMFNLDEPKKSIVVNLEKK